MQTMMPYVKRKSDGILIRLDRYYNTVLEYLGMGDGFEPDQRKETVIKELFGERIIDAAPNSWTYAEAFLAAERMPHEWDRAPIHSRAQWLAAKRIDGMRQVLERYREIMERNRKSLLANKPSTPRKGRR